MKAKQNPYESPATGHRLSKSTPAPEYLERSFWSTLLGYCSIGAVIASIYVIGPTVSYGFSVSILLDGASIFGAAVMASACQSLMLASYVHFRLRNGEPRIIRSRMAIRLGFASAFTFAVAMAAPGVTIALASIEVTLIALLGLASLLVFIPGEILVRTAIPLRDHEKHRTH